MIMKKWLVSKKSLLPYLLLLPGLGLLIYYVLGPAAGHMTSDCTDSLRWAQASLESGHLISENFNYAALLPFGGNLLFLPFVAIFGYSLTAQILGLLFFLLLFAAALYYFARGFELSPLASAGLVSLALMVFSASGKLREIMWEHVFYYNLGLLFFCLGFGLVLRILKEQAGEGEAKRQGLRRGLLLIFSFLAATDGLQTLVLYTLPLGAALLGDRLLDQGRNLRSEENRKNWQTLLLILGASALGFIMIPIISRGVSAGYADAYSGFSAMSKWTENFQNFFLNWFSLQGIAVKDGQHFVGLDSLKDALQIFGAIFLLFFPLIQLGRLTKIRETSLRMLVMAHGAVSAFIFFAVVFGRLGAASWRLTPMLGTAVLTSYVFFVMKLKEGVLARRGAALGLILLAALAFLPGGEILSMKADAGRNNAWFTAAQFLKEQNLKYGYATFWWGELITMLADNQVVVSNMEIKQEAPARRTYQDFLDCYQDRDTTGYFLLLDETEQKTLQNWLQNEKEAGRVMDSYTLITENYSAGGHTGNRLHIYVFNYNFLGN